MEQYGVYCDLVCWLPCKLFQKYIPRSIYGLSLTFQSPSLRYLHTHLTLLLSTHVYCIFSKEHDSFFLPPPSCKGKKAKRCLVGYSTCMKIEMVYLSFTGRLQSMDIICSGRLSNADCINRIIQVFLFVFKYVNS